MENFINSKDTSASVSLCYLKSTGKLDVDGKKDNLKIYIYKTNNYENPDLSISSDVYLTSTADFVKEKGESSMDRYREVVSETLSEPRPCMKMYT